MAIYARDGRHFTALSDPFKPGADDTNEIFGVRLPGSPALDIVNIYRPPISPDEADERQDNFDPDHLPTGDVTTSSSLGTLTPTTRYGTWTAMARMRRARRSRSGWTGLAGRR